MISSNELLLSISNEKEDEKKELRLIDRLQQASIDVTEEVEEPPICLSLQGKEKSYVIGSLGNFSCIVGKAKSRKSFTITMATAAALSADPVLNIKSQFPEGKQKVLYFDTEQAKYHVVNAARRVVKLAGLTQTKHPENFEVYCLRKYNPAERLELIDYAVNHTDGVGLVIIDGIRDCITSINDEAEATFITSKLLKWTEELNIHIMCVLHLNKGNGEARGHVGTEINNKAETVLVVTKDEKDKDISIVESSLGRHLDIEPYAFTIDDDGIPEILEDYQHEKPKENQHNGRPKINPADIALEMHENYVKAIFLGEESLTFKEGIERTTQTYQGFYRSFGRNKAVEFWKYLQANNLVRKLNALYFPVKNEQQPAPF